jgi:hypothetical protein
MGSSYIMFKTLHWTESPIDSFADIETAMFMRESEAPFCEYGLNGIMDLSLSGVCGGTGITEVGYYVRTTFPNVYDGSLWCFHLPADFDLGGFVLLDGSYVIGSEAAIRSDGSDLSFCTEIKKGMHLIEVYGASMKDSVAQPAWYFSVDSQEEWQLFTSDNLNYFMNEPEVQGDTVIWYGESTVDQPDEATWHSIEVDGLYNHPCVIMGPSSNNGEDPITVRVKNVRRTATGKTSF